MKRILLAAIISIALFAGLVFVSSPNKAWSDVASLGSTTLTKTAQIQVWLNGVSYAVNWSDFSRQVLQSTNWVGFSTTTGASNWTYIGS